MIQVSRVSVGFPEGLFILYLLLLKSSAYIDQKNVYIDKWQNL